MNHSKYLFQNQLIPAKGEVAVNVNVEGYSVKRCFLSKPDDSKVQKNSIRVINNEKTKY